MHLSGHLDKHYFLLLIPCRDVQLRALMWLCETTEVGDLSFFVTETGR